MCTIAKEADEAIKAVKPSFAGAVQNEVNLLKTRLRAVGLVLGGRRGKEIALKDVQQPTVLASAASPSKEEPASLDSLATEVKDSVIPPQRLGAGEVQQYEGGGRVEGEAAAAVAEQ